MTRFPNNTSLRISYAFFLIEKTDSKQSAVHELTTAEQNKPPFDEQFIIFRYRKIIDDELAESKNEGNAGLDAMSEQTFQNHLRQFQANIEKSSMLHMEFWSQLGEDNPDLNKLNELGVKIYHSVNNVEDHWNKLQKISANVPKAMKLYGKFLTDITNDKERGEEFLEKARNLININSNKKSTAINFSGNEEISDNSTPTIFVSGETEKIGIITNINLACSSVFGYTKSELINRNVKILMPPMYSKNHDTYIEQYNTTQEMKFIDKERFVFGKHKSYYVFPVFVNIKPINNGQSVQFAGTFRIDKFFKNISYFITNSSGAIDGITSSKFVLISLHQSVKCGPRDDKEEHKHQFLCRYFSLSSPTC
jgi:PAS domain S-box-containing protein